MNFFDYLFIGKEDLEKDLLLGPKTLSYKDLYNKSFLLSKKVVKLNGSGQEIILISPNNEFFMIIYFAIIRSGNICVPLNPSIEKENLEYIIDQTGSQIIFMDDSVKGKFTLEESLQIFTHKDLSYEKYQSLPDIKQGIRENDPAEIIYTSGSTGKPKGVMISHRNLIANTESIINYLPIQSDDIILIVLPFYYCYGLSLLHTHIRKGASIVFNNSFFFLGKVIKDLSDYRCTSFAGVPSHFQLLLRKTKTFKEMEFPSLRYVTQAGGHLPSVFIDEFRNSFPHVSFYVMYGQTEATARLTFLPPDKYPEKKGSIGKAIPGVETKIVDRKDVEVKVNEEGELIARGDNIMKAYYKDADETSKTIRNSWLYTGDLGYKDEEGYIFLTGRSKEMIKVRGNRISPKEIEDIILKLPDVIDCTVFGLNDMVQGEALVAKLVIDKNSKLDGKIVKEYCSRHLVSYKVPEKIELSSKIDVTSTGKKIRNI